MIPLWVPRAVAEELVVDPVRGCWLWQGPLSHNGYGLAIRKRRRVRVHRWVYAASGRPIPDGYDLDHVCRVRSCANPDHVKPRDHREHGVLSAEQARNLAAWEERR